MISHASQASHSFVPLLEGPGSAHTDQIACECLHTSPCCPWRSYIGISLSTHCDILWQSGHSFAKMPQHLQHFSWNLNSGNHTLWNAPEQQTVGQLKGVESYMVHWWHYMILRGGIVEIYSKECRTEIMIENLCETKERHCELFNRLPHLE